MSKPEHSPMPEELTMDTIVRDEMQSRARQIRDQKAAIAELVEALELHEQQYQRGILYSTAEQMDALVETRRALIAKHKAVKP